jgi:general secretion pathway protein A
MLLNYFQFREHPFGSTPDPRCLYQSPTHREALASLKYGFLSNRGFTALIAPPGMGKTTLLFRFLEDIQASARIAFLFNIDSQCQPQELVRYILRDLGIKPADTGAEMHEQLSDVAVAEARAGRTLVIVIDEAQNLSDSALEMVRLLTNFETPQAKLIQIVLAGQEQLAEKLMQPSLLQLRQRISTFCRLGPLSTEETAAYIEHRLKFAGYNGNSLFTKDALNQITEASQGIPRVINNLCFNTLSICCALQRKQVDVRMVAEGISDQQLSLLSKQWDPQVSEAPGMSSERGVQRNGLFSWMKLWIPRIALLSVLCLLGGVRVSGLNRPPVAQEARAETLPVSSPPPSAAVTLAAITLQAASGDSTPKVESFEITVEPNQTIRKIAKQYLGDQDLSRLQQIQDLNPKLIDLNHIEPGQKIRLPQPLTTRIGANKTSSSEARNDTP